MNTASPGQAHVAVGSGGDVPDTGNALADVFMERFDTEDEAAASVIAGVQDLPTPGSGRVCIRIAVRPDRSTGADDAIIDGQAAGTHIHTAGALPGTLASKPPTTTTGENT